MSSVLDLGVCFRLLHRTTDLKSKKEIKDIRGVKIISEVPGTDAELMIIFQKQRVPKGFIFNHSDLEVPFKPQQLANVNNYLFIYLLIKDAILFIHL